MTELRYNDQQYNLKSNQKAISAKAHSHAWLEVSQRFASVSPQYHVPFHVAFFLPSHNERKKNLQEF